MFILGGTAARRPSDYLHVLKLKYVYVAVSGR